MYHMCVCEYRVQKRGALLMYKTNLSDGPLFEIFWSRLKKVRTIFLAVAAVGFSH